MSQASQAVSSDQIQRAAGENRKSGFCWLMRALFSCCNVYAGCVAGGLASAWIAQKRLL